MYLIKKMWTDRLENSLDQAFGYEIIGYVTSKEQAESICEKAGSVEAKGWPLESVNQFDLVKRHSPIPRMIYEEIKPFVLHGDI
jgi:hypothetical protein